MSLARALLAAPLLVAAVLGPMPVSAGGLIPPRVLTRKFPEGQFCALPVSLTFTAPDTPIKVTFEAVQWMAGGFVPLTWTNQAIDNVTIATTAQVVANFALPPTTGSHTNCYNEDPVSYFHFNRAGLTLNLLELFDSDPASRGWTGTAGTSFVNGRSAPSDVEVDGPDDIDGGGCLRLGDGLGTPDPSEIQSASFTLGGLTEGVDYDLGAWWEVNFVRFPHDATYLTIRIETEGGVPVATKSWGAVKNGYRK